MGILWAGEIGRLQELAELDDSTLLDTDLVLIYREEDPSGGQLITTDVVTAAGNILNPTDTYFPIRSGNRFIDSSMREEANQIVSDKTILAPSASFRAGQNVRISDNGGFLSVFAEAFGDNSFYVSELLKETVDELNDDTYGNGVRRPRRVFVLPARWQENFPFDFLNPSTNSITFEYATATNLFFRAVQLRFSEDVDNVRIVVRRRQPDLSYRVVWESHTDGQFAEGLGYNLVAGTNTIDFTVDDQGEVTNEVVNFGRTFEVFNATVETTSDTLPILGFPFEIPGLGLGVQFYPWLLSFAQDWRFLEVTDQADNQPEDIGFTNRQVNLLSQSSPTWRQAGVETDSTSEQLSDEFVEADNDSGFTWTHLDPAATLTSITIRAASDKSDIQFILSSPSDLDFKEQFVEMDIVDGDNVIPFNDERTLEEGQEYRLDIFGFNGVFGEDPMEIKGSGSIPYYTQRIKIYDEQNLVEEAPSDGKQYTRQDGKWEENNSEFTLYSPSGDLTATNTQGAIDELETNKVDDAANVGGEVELFRDKTGTVLNFRTLESSDTSVTVDQGADTIDFSVLGNTLIRTETANYTITLLDQVILCDATGGEITITLPALSSAVGYIFTIKRINSGGNKVIVDANASETIDGELTQSLIRQYDSFTVLGETTEWRIL